MALFDYKAMQEKEIDSELGQSKPYSSKYLASHYQKVSSLENDLIRLPSQEEFLFLQSDTAFNAFTFIPLVAKHYPIKELHASTYSISRKVIDAILQMHHEGIVEKVTIMISDSMIKRNPLVIDNLMAMSKNLPNVTILFAWVHAQVCLWKTSDFHYVIEGSGHWSENAHYEQYLFAESKGLYDFRMKLFTESKLKKY